MASLSGLIGEGQTFSRLSFGDLKLSVTPFPAGDLLGVVLSLEK